MNSVELSCKKFRLLEIVEFLRIIHLGLWEIDQKLSSRRFGLVRCEFSKFWTLVRHRGKSRRIFHFHRATCSSLLLFRAFCPFVSETPGVAKVACDFWPSRRRVTRTGLPRSKKRANPSPTSYLLLEVMKPFSLSCSLCSKRRRSFHSFSRNEGAQKLEY